MEEEIKKEQNEQKRNELLKEAKVREYIAGDNLFQNLFSLPIHVSLERIVERYLLADKDNSTIDVTEEILSGIHESLVKEISNDLNGVVLNPDGTMNKEASEKQEKQLEEEERSRAFYKKEDPEDKVIEAMLWKDPEKEKKEERNVYRESEEELKIKFPSTPDKMDDDAKKEPPKFDVGKRKQEVKSAAKTQPITAIGEKMLNDAIEMNATLISEVKHKGFTAEMYRKLSFEHKYLIKRNLLLEILTTNDTKDIFDTLTKIIPDYENVSPYAIREDLYSQLSDSDNMKKYLRDEETILEPDGLDGHNKENFKEALRNAREQAVLYDKDGNYNYNKVKEVYGDSYVDVMIDDFKKFYIQEALFFKVKDFEKNKLEVLTLYKAALIKEAETIDPERKNDPELWKNIKPKEGSTLEILESQIKENPTLFYDFMNGRMDIEFEKLVDVESEKNVGRFLRPLEKAFGRAEELRKNYPELKADILKRMANIDKHPDKESEMAAIKDSLRKIPRELIKIDFLEEEAYKKYTKEVDPNLETTLFKTHNLRKERIGETKAILLESQKERLKRLGEKNVGTAKDEESKYAGEMFLEEIRSGKLDEKIGRHQEIDAKINVARMQRIKVNNSMLKGKFKISDKTSPETRKRIAGKRKIIKSDTKSIAKAVPLSKYMAKPKMIVDEIEIPVGEETNPQKTSDTFETLLKEQGLIGKFKAMEGELTIDDYASKMGDIIYSINEKVKDGSLPREINIDGSIKETTIQDIVKMNFENTDILFENLPEDISQLSKEEISVLIKDHVQAKGKEEFRKKMDAMKIVAPFSKIEKSDKQDEKANQEIQTEQEPEIENSEESKKEKPKDEKEQEEEEVENDVVPVNSDKKEEGPTQDELQERLAREQRDKELAEENKAKEEVKDIVEEAKAEEPKIEEKKAVESEKAIVKDTFFNRVKRGFLNNPVVKKINELFGKKEEKDVFDTISANDSKNSKPITKEEDDFVQKVDGAKSLKDAHKEMEEKKVRVAVQDSREEEMEIGDE